MSAAVARPARRRRAPGIVAGLAIIAFVTVRFLVAEPFAIPSESMAPTLTAGDHVIVDKLAYRRSAPRAGDLTVFRTPTSGDIMLKRIVAVGGDSVAIRDGVLHVNGTRRHEPYADPDAIDSVYFGPKRIAPGTVFVLGDNRADSQDSRRLGPVAASDLIGRVEARVWPPNRWGVPR